MKTLIAKCGRPLKDGDIVRMMWGTYFGSARKPAIIYRYHKVKDAGLEGCANIIGDGTVEYFEQLPSDVALWQTYYEDNTPAGLVDFIPRETLHIMGMRLLESLKKHSMILGLISEDKHDDTK